MKINIILQKENLLIKNLPKYPPIIYNKNKYIKIYELTYQCLIIPKGKNDKKRFLKLDIDL